MQQLNHFGIPKKLKSFYAGKQLAHADYSKSVHRVLAGCVRNACSKLLELKVLTTHNKLDKTIRLARRLLQHDFDSHDLTIGQQPCVVNDVSIL